MAKNKSLARFEKRLKEIPQAVREAVLPAILRSAEELADRMRSLAPEDEGDLKRSIAVTGPGGSTPAYSSPGGSRVAGELEAIVTVGNEQVRYPHLLEYGTTKAPAQPFFWVSYRLSKKRIISRIKRAINRAVKEKWNAA
jgi:HK97 gp10 family phage protein